MLPRSLALFLLMALPAGAQTIYSLSPEDCGRVANDGSLRLGDGVIHFHEATCTRTSAKRPLGEGWNEADWLCEGEGETWQRRLALRIGRDRVQLRDENGTTDFMACP